MRDVEEVLCQHLSNRRISLMHHSGPSSRQVVARRSSDIPLSVDNGSTIPKLSRKSRSNYSTGRNTNLKRCTVGGLSVDVGKGCNSGGPSSSHRLTGNGDGSARSSGKIR